ncbi:hypothetical protein N7465_004521 [Penicillium sp. CMV-2018d]|nr:hypothetical protein N7465_004521 [Penicillium sp. CMV-2018d]
MRTLGFIVIDNEEITVQRVWSSEMQQPVGQSSVRIIRSAALYEQATPQGPFAILMAKKDMVLHGFELVRQSSVKASPVKDGRPRDITLAMREARPSG